MKHCFACGHKLEMRELEHEGMTPFCPNCKEFRFPIFNTAVSMVVVNPKEDKILMIQQYGRESNILVAGYVNKGESGEDALRREMEEEIGRKVIKHRFMKTEYFPKSNTLIWNFAVMIDSEDLSGVCEWEVDKATWFTFEEAKESVKHDSLAERFLYYFFKKYETKTGDFFE
ncbi:NAD(+) diphosphatase [Amedibacillus sp. YH-ame10]